MTDEFDEIFGRAVPPRPGFADKLKPNINPTPSSQVAESVVGSGPYKAYGYIDVTPVSHPAITRVLG